MGLSCQDEEASVTGGVCHVTKRRVSVMSRR